MKYSCVIGTYNPKAEWLRRAIDSASLHFDEIIVVDDGSDGVHPIVEPNVDKLVRHSSNRGFYEAKNTAIKEATGDVIAILDDDDYFEERGVFLLQQHIEQSTADIWHFILNKFNEEVGQYGVNANPADLTSYNSIPGVSWFRKKVWEDLGGYKYPLAEDWDFWLRAFRRGFKFEYVPEVVYNMNVRSGSISRSWTKPFDEMRKEILNNE